MVIRVVGLVELGTRVKTARKVRGFTLDDLTKRSGLGKGVLSKVEIFRKTTSFSSIIKIAAALVIPLEKLFEGLDQKPETWISLGTQTGASSTSGDSTATGVSWNLGAVGTQTSVDFLIDPVSTSATNGNYNQRGVAMGNFALNATAVPEPSSAALLGLGGLALVFRRRK